MSDDIRRGPGRPPSMPKELLEQAPAPAAAAAAANGTGQAKKAPLVEVELMRRYAPRWLVRPDGSVVEQTGELQTVVLKPGVTMLHHEEVPKVMNNGTARMTYNTFKALESENPS